MRHSFLDKYSSIDSPIHRVNPRIKIISSIVFLLYVIMFAERWEWSYFACFLFLLVLVFISMVPISFVLKRAIAILPFLLFIAIFIPFFREDGIKVFTLTLVKSILSITTLILLTSTTKFSDLLNGLTKLKVPTIITTILSFMYRYFFVLIDEIERMARAMSMRTFRRNRIKAIKVLAHIIGVLFIRSYERSERVYNAMLMRGFDGRIRK